MQPFFKTTLRFLLKYWGVFLDFLNFDSGGDFGVDFQILREKSVPNDQKPPNINQNQSQIIKNHQTTAKNTDDHDHDFDHA